MPKSCDLLITEVRTALQEHDYRTPMKFGGKVVERAVILDVAVRVRTRAGRDAAGFGSMPMGNTWSFPSARLGLDETLAAMLDLAGRIAAGLPDASGGEMLDPMEHGGLVEELALAEAGAVRRDRRLGEAIPKLCALVTASAFDAAIHDAFGKVMDRPVWACYGEEFLNRDLGEYLDAGFAGRYPAQYLAAEPKARMPLYHLVGALDPLTAEDVSSPAGDGLPEHLGEWIARDGLTHLKVKLNGDDLAWDLERVLSVDRVALGAAEDRDWRYSLDFNERCEDVEYLLAFLRGLGEREPRAMGRVEYVEQPTARKLVDRPEFAMHQAAEIKPVVIDESLTGYDAMVRAGDLGYSGVALKACKGQTGSLLMAAAAAERDMFVCVQDLTCPGASFLHSASLASRVPGAAGVEGNARQYCPAANDGWRERFPTVFGVEGGSIETGAISGPGLGCVPVDHSIGKLEEA